MDARTTLSRRGLGRMGLGLLGAAALGRALRPCAAANTRPHSPGVNEAFLAEQARRIVASAHLPAGRRARDSSEIGGPADSATAEVSKAAAPNPNRTIYDLHVPGGNMGYPAFWTRDAVMMLGGDFISARELEGWIRLMCSTLRGPEDWQVRPGVTVPAYVVPDHINFDGKATFYPGNYETGEKQGGHPWGKYPPLDDNFYFVTAAYEYWRLTEDPGLLRTRIRTFSGGEDLDLSALCEKVYRQPPADETTGLVMAGDIDSEHAKDWGFCDAEFKSGRLLFPSILKMNAAGQLAELFAALGQTEPAEAYRRDARRLADAIATTFLRPNNGGAEAWLHSATGVGNQPDVWGSAFAVHSGALAAPVAQKVSRALVRAFRERTAVQNGLIRHILTTDQANHGGWYASISEVGTYQNGGYWAAPVGWYISAIHKSDPTAAADLAKEYLGFLRAHMRPDGMTEAWEWCNADTGARANPLYVASVALPYLSLKTAGLLHLLDEK